MWPRKRYAIVFLLGVGLLTALIGASGQDQRLPWPPRPVQPPETPIIVETTPRERPKEKPDAKPAPLPLVTSEPGTILQVSAPPQEVPNVKPPAIPDVPPVLPDLPPPAPTPIVPAPTESLIPKKTEAEPKGPTLLPDPPAVMLPEPTPKVIVPPNELPVVKPAVPEIPTVQATPIITETPKVAPPAHTGGSQPGVSRNPPKTITIAPSQPQIKETAPEPVRPPAFRVVAPIRKTVQPVETPTLPPPQIPRETFAPPIPTYNVAPPVLGTQTPAVTFEKKGPPSAPINQTARFEIIVRNAGSVTAQKIQVEDELPPGVRFMGGDPQPLLRGDRVTWNIDSLAPNAERRLFLDLQATAAGDLGTNTTVTVSATKTGRAVGTVPARLEDSPRGLVNQAPMTLSIKGPSGAAVGQPVVFEIEMGNNTQRPLPNLVLQAVIPAGLNHPLGDRIEADVNDLPPLTSKSFPLQTTAAKPGRHTIQIKILMQDGKEASAQAVVVIGEPGVNVRPAGTSRLMLDREGEIQLEVANSTNRTARNIVVTDSVPEGLVFVDASDRGLYRDSTRSVYWMIDDLAAGQTKTLTVKVRPHAPGEYTHQAVAKSDEGRESKVVAAVVVETLANLEVKVTGRDNPVEVGRQATYEILVQNQGNGPATGVRISALVPEGMRPAAARGPTAYGIHGQQVIFEPLPRLDARKQMIFEIAALAQSPGDRRMRVQVTSDQMQTPMAREERTWVYVE